MESAQQSNYGDIITPLGHGIHQGLVGVPISDYSSQLIHAGAVSNVEDNNTKTSASLPPNGSRCWKPVVFSVSGGDLLRLHFTVIVIYGGPF